MLHVCHDSNWHVCEMTPKFNQARNMYKTKYTWNMYVSYCHSSDGWVQKQVCNRYVYKHPWHMGVTWV